MQLFDKGEFNLIDDIKRIIDEKANRHSSSWHNLLSGIGDDTAIWETRNELALATTDSLVENIHFDLRYSSWADIGWKLLAINISDIAAMGGIPDYSLVSLALPGSLDSSSIYKFYESALEIANKYGVAICGGNISFSPQIVLSATVIGHASERKVLKRSASKPGDCVSVTGYPGLSAAGLQVLRSGVPLNDADRAMIASAHLRPSPKIEAGQTLVNCGVKAAIDISDGLLADLGHICTESHVGARIFAPRVPVHTLLENIFGADSLKMALTGGEDYELIFTADKASTKIVKKQLKDHLTVIGEITEEHPGKVLLIDESGNQLPGYQTAGWNHFQKH